MAGFQGPFHTSLQVLPDPQENKRGGSWVWGIIESFIGDRGPSQHCRCAAITCIFSNGRQVGNGKPHHHQSHIISEPNLSTRESFGDFQATAGTTSPDKNKDTSRKENNTR